jgi:hypothetical protein
MGKLAGWLLMGAIAIGLLGTVVEAKERKKKAPREKPKMETILGKVTVTADDEGNVKAVTLTAEGDEAPQYTVTMNKHGKEMAEKCAGKRVEAKGTVRKRRNKLLLTVRSYKLVEEEEEKDEEDAVILPPEEDGE